MQWKIPKTDGGIAAWLRSLDEDTLDAFIADADYLLGDGEGSDQHLVLATILGAARQWRDEAVDPLTTLRHTAPTGFYETEAAA